MNSYHEVGLPINFNITDLKSTNSSEGSSFGENRVSNEKFSIKKDCENVSNVLWV